MKKAQSPCYRRVNGCESGTAGQNDGRMSSALSPPHGDAVVLEHGALSVEVALRPFSVTVRRDGRSLVRRLELWCADGVVHDHFVLMTEGVLAHEELEDREVAVAAAPRGTALGRASRRFELGLRGGRRARLSVALTAYGVLLDFEAEDAPLRIGASWDTRAAERFVGLGARHGVTLDQSRRTVQLGADRRYTGPDCPPEMLAGGGIPQGDCAPAPWVVCSRGYAVWAQTGGNGTVFAFGEDRAGVSVRSRSGPLRLHLLCARTPAARLRDYCRMTGFAPVLPEWGYGFWKSRDVYDHQDEVVEDFDGFREHRIPLDAIVLDSPWATQYNTWQFNPFQFPDVEGMLSAFRRDGVRTVVWVTPWVNLDSRDGQIPSDAGSQRLHSAPAPNYDAADAAGHFVRAGDESWVGQWWMGTGSLVDFTSPAAEEWWRTSARRLLALGVEGIKADDGEGYYIPDDLSFADGRRGADAAWEYGALYRASMQRALDEAHPARGVLFGRSGWSGQQSVGMLWGGDQASDFWSLRALVCATLAAACSGVSNWSHDVGGYLGHRLVERCPPELLVRWAQFGCFTPLMHAHGRMPQEPWRYDERILDLYRGYVLLHEQLVPYVRAAAALAARSGLPIVRPLCLVDPADPRGWELADAFAYGPSLWVAPVLEEGAREREVWLPRGEWIEAWSGARVRGGVDVVAPAPLAGTPLWVRAGAIVVTYPSWHVAAGLGDEDEGSRPLVATLWGEPPGGRAVARLCDGTVVRWARGRWSVDREREVEFAERGG